MQPIKLEASTVAQIDEQPIKLYIGNISYNVKEQDLEREFAVVSVHGEGHASSSSLPPPDLLSLHSTAPFAV